VDVDIHPFVAGPLETNTYLLSHRTDGWIIDPAMGMGDVARFIRSRRIELRRVLLTHGHGDHIAGIGELKRDWPGLKVFCPRAEAGMLTDPQANLSGAFGLDITAGAPDELVEPGQTLQAGGLELLVLDTPGHTPGSVSYYCPAARAVFTGDALFAGSVGRSDLPGGDHTRLIESIRRSLLSLPDETVVLPGHGPSTTIGHERRTNPFLLD